MGAVRALVIVIPPLMAVFSWMRDRRDSAILANYRHHLNRASVTLTRHDAAAALTEYQDLIVSIGQVTSPTPDLLQIKGQAHCAVADIHREAGCTQEAVEALHEALQGGMAPVMLVGRIARQSAERGNLTDVAVVVYMQHIANIRGTPSQSDPVIAFLHWQCRLNPDLDTIGAQKLVVLASQIVQADPTLAWAYAAIGRAEAYLGNRAGALAAYGHAELLDPTQADVAYSVGQLYLSRGEFAAAYEAVTRAERLGLQYPEVLDQIAFLRFALSDLGGAVGIDLDRALAGARRACEVTSERADLWLLLGQIELLRHGPRLAKPALAKAAAMEPAEPEFQMPLVGALISLGELAPAYAGLRHVVQVAPHYAPAHLRLADLSRSDGDVALAATQYRKALELDAGLAAARIGLGCCLYQEGEFAEVIKQLQAVFQMTAEGLYTLGRAYAQIGDQAQAVLAYESWQRTYGTDVDVCFSLGCAYSKLGKWNWALAAFQQADNAAKVEGRRKEGLAFWRGTALLHAGQMQAAQVAYEEAAAAAPADPQVHYALGKLALRQGAFEQAGQFFARAISLDPGYAPAHFGLGMLHERVGSLAAAAAEYATGLRADPDWQPALVRLWVIQVKTGDWTAALSTLQRIQPDGDNVDEVYFYVGLAQANLRRYEDALNTWQGLLARFPDDAVLFANRAFVFDQLGRDSFAGGDYLGAIHHWEQCRIAPNEQELNHCLAEACVRFAVLLLSQPNTGQSNRPQVRRFLQRAASLDPRNRSASSILGLVTLQEGDNAEAAAILQPLVHERPEDCIDRYHLALALLAQGNVVDASPVLAGPRSFAARCGPGLHLAEGNAALLQGRWSDALTSYRAALVLPQGFGRSGESYCAACTSVVPRGEVDGAIHGTPYCPRCLDALLTLIALSAWRSDRHEEVMPELEPYIGSAVVFPEVQRHLGLLHAHLGRLDRALDLLRPLASAQGDRGAISALAWIHLKRAASYVSQGDYALSVPDLIEASGYAPNLPVARDALTLVSDWRAWRCFNAGQLEEAMVIWEAEFARRPTDLSTTHNLAILSYRLASEREADALAGGLAIDAALPAVDLYWRKAVAYWATVLHSPRFWTHWQIGRSRQVSLAFSDEDLTAVRAAMHERLIRDFRDYASRYREAGQSANIRFFEDLEIAWGIEQRTAELVSECLRSYGIGGWPYGYACGPVMLEWLGTTVAGAQAGNALRQCVQAFPAPAGPCLKRYLSPLARWQYLLEKERLDEIITEAEWCRKYADGNALLSTTYSLKGQELAELQRWRDALEAFEVAQTYGAVLNGYAPLLSDITLRLSKESLAVDDCDSAIAVLRRGLALAGDGSEIRSDLAAVHVRKAGNANMAERYEEALHLVRTALTCAPDEETTRHYLHLALGNLASSLVQRDANRAILLFEEAISYEYDSDTSARLARLLLRCSINAALNGQHEEAIEHMHEYMFYDPEVTIERSESEAKRWIQRTLSDHAIELAQKGEFDNAVRHARIARTYRDDRKVRLLLADLLYFSHSHDESEQLLRDELQRMPGEPEAGRILARVLVAKATAAVEKRNTQQAMSLLKEALANARDDEAIRDNVIHLYFELEYYDEAILILRHSLAHDPSNSIARHNLAAALCNRSVQFSQQGWNDQSVTYLQQALAVLDTTSTRVMLANCLAKRAYGHAQVGDRYRANMDLRAAIEYDPTNTALRQALYTLSQ